MTQEIKEAILNYPEYYSTKEVKSLLFAEMSIIVSESDIMIVRQEGDAQWENG